MSLTGKRKARSSVAQAASTPTPSKAKPAPPPEPALVDEDADNDSEMQHDASDYWQLLYQYSYQLLGIHQAPSPSLTDTRSLLQSLTALPLSATSVDESAVHGIQSNIDRLSSLSTPPQSAMSLQTQTSHSFGHQRTKLIFLATQLIARCHASQSPIAEGSFSAAVVGKCTALFASQLVQLKDSNASSSTASSAALDAALLTILTSNQLQSRAERALWLASFQ